jgi:RNA polymerase sigma-70 factor, ECF subfamily
MRATRPPSRFSISVTAIGWFALRGDSPAANTLRSTFLYPVVRNHSLNAIGKARKLHSGTEEIRHLENLAVPGFPPGASDDFDVVLSALSEDHRETLMLRFIDGLSLAEIAEATGIPLGTAKSRLHHAISKLREDPLTREFFLQ